GGALGVRVSGVDTDTMLVFLSSGCETCGAFWRDLAAPDLPSGTRLVVVTRGDDAESPAAVARLAPPGVAVVMSGDAWRDYGVPGTPYVVHVDGATGRIRGQGTGGDWRQVRRLFLEASGDTSPTNGRRPAGKASADHRREAEIDRVLTVNGYVPGDPRLFDPPSPPQAASGAEPQGRDDGAGG
ncbi:MAG: TlpA family protein disulfide reductase, partial [Nitriliruptorales bacterium]